MNYEDFRDALISSQTDSPQDDPTVIIVDRYGDPHKVNEVCWDEELEAIVVDMGGPR